MLKSALFYVVWSTFDLVLCPELPVITKKPGDNVLFHCQDPRNESIEILEWIRPDLHSEGYVFYLKDEQIYKHFQHTYFRDRVDLTDPEMKDGKISVILKNVNTSDTGTYLCNITTTNTVITICNISLIVKDPGDAAGKNRAYGGMIAGLSVFGVCVAVIAVLVFKIYMKYKGYSKQIPDDTDGINNI